MKNALDILKVAAFVISMVLLLPIIIPIMIGSYVLQFFSGFFERKEGEDYVKYPIKPSNDEDLGIGGPEWTKIYDSEPTKEPTIRG